MERRRSALLPYDIQPVPSASIQDLDTDFFERVYLRAAFPSDVLDENQRTLDQRLASIRFLNGDGVPTVLGLLVLGIEPTEHVPGAYVQFLRLDGSDLADPIKDHKELRGPLPEQLAALDEILQLNVSASVEVEAASTEVRTPDYPVAALIQLARNAILHRTYEGTRAPVRITWFNDRVEIWNPGGPFGQVTVDNLGQSGVVDYRNPNLAEAMRVLGWVQRFGVGIPIARRELERNGNPPPDFQANSGNVLVVVGVHL